MRRNFVVVSGAIVLLPRVVYAGEHESHGTGWEPHWALCVPFALTLLSIATFPLIRATSHWWEHNTNKAKVVGVLALPVLVALTLFDVENLVHTGIEYFQFVSLLAALFIVAGGIHIKGNLKAKPSTNTAILGSGFLLASLVGTTGASMICLYPLLRANEERRRKMHTFVFFILAVSNMGGLLTPLGDPPLFLGYLKGVNFFWWTRLWWVWAAGGAYLLGLYWLFDTYQYAKEEVIDLRRDEIAHEALGIMGGINVLLVGGIAVTTLFAPTPLREVLYWSLAGVSLLVSQEGENALAREKNNFSFGPIVEVFVLFAGIFITMVPTIALLEIHGERFGVTQPWQYFLASGGFSSVLDNAPTYLIFGQLGVTSNGLHSLLELSENKVSLHAAISIGAVFMGANTYVGNAPNFMVKATCEERGVKMPDFFSYTLLAITILAPVYMFIVFILPYIS